MEAHQFNNQALLLHNGKILIIGGVANDKQVTSNIQIYNPDTNKFYQAGNMQIARSAPEAILLKNGKVLIIGGININDRPEITAELYDPKSKKSFIVGNMKIKRGSNCSIKTAMLSNGNIFIVGGYPEFESFFSKLEPVYKVELFDVSSKKFTIIGETYSKSETPELTLLKNNNILITGGHIRPNGSSHDVSINDVELFIPKSFVE